MGGSRPSSFSLMEADMGGAVGCRVARQTGRRSALALQNVDENAAPLAKHATVSRHHGIGAMGASACWLLALVCTALGSKWCWLAKENERGPIHEGDAVSFDTVIASVGTLSKRQRKALAGKLGFSDGGGGGGKQRVKPEPKKQQKKKKRVETRACFQCGKTGHIKQDCTQVPRDDAADPDP